MAKRRPSSLLYQPFSRPQEYLFEVIQRLFIDVHRYPGTNQPGQYCAQQKIVAVYA